MNTYGAVDEPDDNWNCHRTDGTGAAETATDDETMNLVRQFFPPDLQARLLDVNESAEIDTLGETLVSVLRLGLDVCELAPTEQHFEVVAGARKRRVKMRCAALSRA